MLPPQHKLQASSDFARVVKSGTRKPAGTVLVYLHQNAPHQQPNPAALSRTDIRHGGPRLGLIVGKKVGNAVTRHQVSRRLRHIFASLVPQLPSDCDIVIRALPSAATASSSVLRKHVVKALVKQGIAGLE